MGWILFFTVFTIPLTFFPWGYVSFEPPKVLLFYILLLALVFLFFIKRIKLHSINQIHFFAILFFTWLFLASIVGTDFWHSFWGSYFRREGLMTNFFLLVLFLASGFILKQAFWRKQIAIAICLAATIASLLGFLQFIFVWFFGSSLQLLYSGRIISTFGQSNFLGAFLVLSLPFFVYMASLEKGKSKFLLWLAAGIVIVTLSLTFSRSAFLGFIAMVLFLAFYRIKVFFVILIGLILLGSALANLSPTLTFREWHRIQTDLEKKWTAENRLLISKKSMDLIKIRLITGWGVENFVFVFPIVVSKDDFGLKDIVVDSSHNLFLDTAVEGGIVSLLIFMGFLISIFWLGIKKLKTVQGEEKIFLKIVLVGMLSYLVIHQFTVDSIAPNIIFWLSAGGVAGSAFVGSFSKNKIYDLVYISLAVISIILLFWFVIQTLKADMIFAQGSKLEAVDTRKAMEHHEKAFKEAPWIKYYQLRKEFLKK